MCALHVQNPDGVKIYNLSAGKKLPEFLSERQRRLLNKRDGARDARGACAGLAALARPLLNAAAAAALALRRVPQARGAHPGL